MGQVAEHVSDPQKTIEKVHSIMNASGTFTLIAPNINSVAAKVFRSYWFALEVPRHLFLFSAQALSHMLRKGGFKIESITYDHEPKTAVRSIHYLLGGRSIGIDPIFR